MTEENGFRQLSWDEVVAMHRAAGGQPVEDAEFTVEEPGEEPPQWQVWAETYPWREADARRFLDFEAESHGAYWYRDRRDGRRYGMPSLEAVRRANERFERRAGADRRRWTYALRWVGVYVVLSCGLIGAVGPVVVWSWLALPFLALWLGRKRRLASGIDYAKIVGEVRFDEFTSDEEREELRRALLVAGVTAGGFYALHKFRQWSRHLHED